MNSTAEQVIAVKCRFLDENGEPKGREYTYATTTPLEAGCHVTTDNGKSLIVTETDLSSDSIRGIESKLKFVVLKQIVEDVDESVDVVESTAITETTPTMKRPCKMVRMCFFRRMQTMSKYGNGKTVIDNIAFDSKAEAIRYQELKLQQAAGQNMGLEIQPKFLILEAYKAISRKKHRAKYYIADFKYNRFGATIVENVKSDTTRRNPVYTLKFEARYTDIAFREVM